MPKDNKKEKGKLRKDDEYQIVVFCNMKCLLKKTSLRIYPKDV